MSQKCLHLNPGWGAWKGLPNSSLPRGSLLLIANATFLAQAWTILSALNLIQICSMPLGKGPPSPVLSLDFLL